MSRPRPIDEDEFIEIESNITRERLNEIIFAGEMNIASSFVVLMGLKRLDELGLVS